MITFVIIVLGVLLPLVVVLDRVFKNQKFWISFIGTLIVASQGLSQEFSQEFQYKGTWENYMVAKLELESAHRDWQRKIIDASMKKDGLSDAQCATEAFSKNVSKIVLDETTSFFKSISD